MEFNLASSKKTQGARYLSRATFFALRLCSVSVSVFLHLLTCKHYDLAEKEGNCHSRHFERNSGSIFIAGKHNFCQLFKLTAELKFHYRLQYEESKPLTSYL